MWGDSHLCKSRGLHLTYSISPILSVLKSSLVWFFAFFGHNWTETGPKNSVQTCNHNCNHMQLVACSCMVSCNWLPTRLVLNQLQHKVYIQLLTIYWLLTYCFVLVLYSCVDQSGFTVSAATTVQHLTSMHKCCVIYWYIFGMHILLS